MNEKIKDSFLLLLKMGLWDKQEINYPNFPLCGEEWALIYKISIGQTVEGLVYEGILNLPKEFLPSNDILFRWTARVDSIERRNKRMRKTIATLAKGFRTNDIQFVLLKGLGLAEFYKNPNVRISGDVDFFFKSKTDYNKANQLLVHHGIKINKGDHQSKVYIFNNTDIEHHTRMIDIFNPFAQSLIRALIEKESSLSKLVAFEKEMVEVPSDILNHIQVNAHILKHYLGFGIGLRQICDVARLCYKMDHNTDVKQLKYIYTKLGINKWVNAIHNLLVKDLGLDHGKLPYPLEKDFNTQPLLKDILNSGNFGFHDVRYLKDKRDISQRHNKRDNVLRRILPHTLKGISLAPSEVFWFPLNKLYSKVTGN